MASQYHNAPQPEIANMEFMKLELLKKGALCAADCRKCGATLYCHEWATWDNNDMRDAMQNGTAQCPECHGTVDPETFTDCGRQYACRYSAPGYLDCTEYSYGKNKRKLMRDVREMYGD
jgi:hypothetical protein